MKRIRLAHLLPTGIIMTRILNLPLLLSLLCNSTALYARAGSSGGGGGGFRIIGINLNGGIASLLWLLIFPVIFVYFIWDKKQIDKRKEDIKKILEQMAKIEPEWSEEALLAFSREQFLQIQEEWCSQDLVALSKRLSPELFSDWKSRLKKQQEQNIRQSLEDLAIKEIFIVDVKNYKNDELDEFTLCIDASCADKTFRNNELVKINNAPFREFWTFVRSDKNWKLLRIHQGDGWQKFVNSQIVYEKVVSKK